VTIWVTGAGGMLGRCVGQQLSALGLAWVGTDTEVDIADQSAADSFASANQPVAVINCAAYTAVDAAEKDEAGAFRANAVGPKVLASLCRSRQMAFTHVSTDYVFDGQRSGQHREDSPVGPCNAYGRTKLAGERMIADVFSAENPSASPSWTIIRTSWLFGEGRSSFVESMWKLMLSQRELRVVNDQYGRPTYAGDLAAILIRAIGASNSSPLPSGIWHFANSGATTWFEYACRIRELMIEAGMSVATNDIIPVTTAEFPRPAPRPANSVLSTERLEAATGSIPRPWQDALREYIKVRSGGW
jgi:dTDP-4-dehydrorhamnose reductase